MPRPVGITKEFSAKDRSKSKFVAPHSPWQLMVTERMKKLNLSWRKASKMLAERGQDITHLTLWNWTRNRQGYPSRAYSRSLNSALAETIGIDPEELSALRDQSMTLTTKPPKERGLYALQRIVEESAKSSWTKEDLLREIQHLI